MPTLEQIKKHYNQLTAPERFALMVSAGSRGDRAGRDELLASAPKVTFEFPHIQGLADGFEALSNYHIMQQLGTAGTFFMLIHLSDGQDNPQPIATIEGEEYTQETAITLTARRFMEGLEAYRAVCQEYNIDPEALEGMYQQYDQLTAMTELIIMRAFDIAPTELTDLESTKDGYRKVIETSRKHWAESLAK